MYVPNELGPILMKLLRNLENNLAGNILNSDFRSLGRQACQNPICILLRLHLYLWIDPILRFASPFVHFLQ